jgi:hypothetical protein
MCVIVLVDNPEFQPTHEMLRLMHKQNSDGVGIAYLKGDRIRFEKGLLDHEELIQLMEELAIQPPYAIHFRKTSVGSTCEELTQPFPVTKKAEISLRGETSEILMHNGTWGNWDSALVNMCLSQGLKLPDGEWNDSRAMAFIMAKHGGALLSVMLGSNWSRVITFDKHGFHFHHGEMIYQDGMWFSNLIWEPAKPVAQTVVPAVATPQVVQAQPVVPVAPANHVKYINVDHWSNLDDKRKSELAAAIRRSPKWAKCSESKCLKELYKGTTLAEPQSMDYCDQCKTDGGKGCKQAKEPVVTPVPSCLPVTVVPLPRKCTATLCTNIVLDGNWFCSECDAQFNRHMGEM